MLADSSLEFGADKIVAQVKLVVWDLDDTFWQGTLSEGPVTYVPEHVQCVRTLAERGIISAICSKNDYEAARAALQDCGAWDYFVFNKIDFSPKGARVAALVEEMNLRPVNVLFIDDNPVNLREVEYAVPGVMVAHPDAVLSGLLENRFLAGKPDLALARLQQYKRLERKVVDQAQNTLSNTAFLRQCDIRVTFLYDLEPHIERLLDLIDRANQLNFTKRRVGTQREDFIAQLRRRDVYAGAVSVADRYGDYGIAGFFLHVKDPLAPRLEQFVFSCRIMNMGVEQFVYDHLGRPPLDVAQPVAYPVVSFEKVDWITIGTDDGPAEESVSDARLLLIGGCDLLQVASYCSSRRTEFVNDARGGLFIRYDDFGFILSDRARLSASQVLPQIPCWTADEALALDRELAQAEVVVISLWVALRGHYVATEDRVVVRVHPYGLGEFLDAGRRSDLLQRAGIFKLRPDQNDALLRASILALAARSPRAGCRVLLGANTRFVDGSVGKEEMQQRVLYNATCEDLARTHDGLSYVSIDDLVPLSQMVDDSHCSRMGYLTIAEEVKRRVTLVERPGGTVSAPEISVWDVVKEGRRIWSGEALGPVAHEPNLPKRLLKRVLRSSATGQAALRLAKVLKNKAAGLSAAA